jgi:hypothetical protein
LDKWIKDNLSKGYIRPSSSPQASPFFFVGKKDGDLQPCQDYKYLNSWTVKNAYPIPLISEIIDKLKTARVFTKFDVRGITMSESKMEISGKPHSKPTKAYLSLW